jgi:ubiquitin carboxyl-terminal hydrolase 22/27/51
LISLQSVLCLPPLKAHYLSGGHAAGACAARRRARGAAAAAAPCLGCELDAAFGRAFAPPPRGSPAGAPRAPWSPAALLAAWWRSAEALASYQQQDAHEFFLSLVEAVHTATSAQDRERRPTTPAAALLRSPSCGLGSPRAGFGAGAAGCDADCGCAMHRAFGGLLRSDVVCAGCGGCSTALDPFVDVSLELDSAGAAASSQALTLGACLRRFTRPERLGGGARVLACAACGTGPQAGTKQLSFAAAPPALCLHLKRFAHGARIAPHGAGAGGGSGGSGNGTSAAGGASGTGGNAEASKLDFHVSFPLDDLDLGPFLAPARLRARAGHRVSAETAPASSSKCLYWLAAAVCHVGSLEGGHYVAYARHGGAWFRCDDSWVTAVPAAEVAAAQAYLLFYASHAVTSTHPPGGA